MKACCCRAFTIKFSPEEFWENYQHYIVEKQIGVDANGHGQFFDVEKLVDMLLYMGQRVSAPDGTRWSHNGEWPWHFYTCRHLDRRTGTCRQYEDRPDMCRLYPGKGECDYPDCESTQCMFHSSRREHRLLLQAGNG